MEPTVTTPRLYHIKCLTFKLWTRYFRLLESIFHEEQNPDPNWLLKIAQFTERNVEDVAKWFKTRNMKRPCDIGYWNIL